MDECHHLRWPSPLTQKRWVFLIGKVLQRKPAQACHLNSRVLPAMQKMMIRSCNRSFFSLGTGHVCHHSEKDEEDSWHLGHPTVSVVLPACTGATLSVTEDGRRLYMFGGNDGTRALNDVYFMEIERLSWGYLPVHVSACTHVYLLWCAQAAHSRRG